MKSHNKPHWLKEVKMGKDGIVKHVPYGIGDYMLMKGPYVEQLTTRTRIITNNRGDKELRGDIVRKNPDSFESGRFTCHSCHQAIKGFSNYLEHLISCKTK